MLSIEYMATGLLIPYINNSRTHSEQQVQQVAASIKEFGFTNPILIDEGGGVIAGHGRLMAAQMLGLNDVPTITLEGLTEAQRKAYVIADNKLALNSGWNNESLLNEIARLKEGEFDIGMLGFSEIELEGLLDDDIDYTLLDEVADEELIEFEENVKKAIQIEFEAEHYDDAREIVEWYRKQGAYIGYMFLTYLQSEKEKIDSL